jgi:hypothetical protein
MAANTACCYSTLSGRLDVSCQVKYDSYIAFAPIPVAARSKAWVCDGPVAGISGSNPPWWLGFVSLCCERYILSGRSLCVGLIQRIPTQCGLSESDREPSTMGRTFCHNSCSRVKDQLGDRRYSVIVSSLSVSKYTVNL